MNAAGWLSLRKAAQLLGCTAYSVKTACIAGSIRTRRQPLTGVILYCREDVEQLAQSLAGV